MMHFTICPPTHLFIFCLGMFLLYKGGYNMVVFLFVLFSFIFHFFLSFGFCYSLENAFFFFFCLVVKMYSLDIVFNIC